MNIDKSVFPFPSEMYTNYGMTYRDLLIALAFHAAMIKSDNSGPESVAENCIRYAEALIDKLKARKVDTKPSCV